MSLKRIASILVLCAVIAVSAAVVAGCSKSDADTVRDDVKKELDSIKSMSGDVADKLAKEADAAYQPYGISGSDFVKSLFADFDYSVGDVKIDGNNATVEVTLKMKPLSSLNETLGTALSEVLAQADDETMVNEETFRKKIGEAIMSSLDSIEAQELSPVTQKFTKADGKWASASENADILLKAYQQS